MLKATERAASEAPPQETEMGITPIDYSMSQNEKDKLYVEMLYTIANTVSNIFYLFLNVTKLFTWCVLSSRVASGILYVGFFEPNETKLDGIATYYSKSEFK